MTSEELLQLDLPNKRAELVRGMLVVREPAGFRHGAVVARMTQRISQFVEERQLGVVVAAETGFTLRRDPDTVRAPDIAFISGARCPDPEFASFAELAPDLVVEVLSPSDRPGEVLAKCADWLDAGSRLVWIVDPGRREGRVHRADGSATFIADTGSFDGEDVMPEFSCTLASVVLP